MVWHLCFNSISKCQSNKWIKLFTDSRNNGRFVAITIWFGVDGDDVVAATATITTAILRWRCRWHYLFRWFIRRGLYWFGCCRGGCGFRCIGRTATMFWLRNTSIVRRWTNCISSHCIYRVQLTIGIQNGLICICIGGRLIAARFLNITQMFHEIFSITCCFEIDRLHIVLVVGNLTVIWHSCATFAAKVTVIKIGREITGRAITVSALITAIIGENYIYHHRYMVDNRNQIDNFPHCHNNVAVLGMKTLNLPYLNRSFRLAYNSDYSNSHF